MTDADAKCQFPQILVLVRYNKALGFARFKPVGCCGTEQHHHTQNQDYNHDHSCEYSHPGTLAANIKGYYRVVSGYAAHMTRPRK